MVLAGLYTLAASLIWSVNTLFLLDAGLGIGEVFLANALFSAGMVVFEIPTGVVADTLGRRVSYLFSVTTLAVTTVLYVLASVADQGIVVFGAISILMGLGFTFYSGALEAWLVDALRSVGVDGDLDHVFARSAQVTGLAMLIGTTTGGFLGQIDLAVPFVVRAVVLVGVFGRVISPIGGAVEGLVLGGAAGLGYALSTAPLPGGGLAGPRGRARARTALLTGAACAVAAMIRAIDVFQELRQPITNPHRLPRRLSGTHQAPHGRPAPGRAIKCGVQPVHGRRGGFISSAGACGDVRKGQ